MVDATEVPKLFSRQAGLLPIEGLSTNRVVIAGTGAVGSQLAQQLVLCGQLDITLYDFDTVEEENLYPQGWSESDQGEAKVYALANRLNAMRSDAQISPQNTPFPLQGVEADVLFMCVDSIAVRQDIWEAYQRKVGLIIDTRVAAEVIRVITSCEEVGWDYYRDTLFRPEQAFEGACTTKMTLHHANLAAALALQQYSLWMRQIPIERDVSFNALAMELMTE